MNRKKALVTKTPKDYKLLWMAMPFIVIVFLFSYVPIFGWIYSFFDYVPGVSIFNCDFVGLDYFKLIFRDDNILRSLKNTFIFAIINICLTPLPMFMAILLNELRNGPIKKFTQTFTTLPNFISWVIIFSLATALFASDGIVTGLATAMGLGDASNSLLGSNEAVYWFQSFLLQWKTLGWNSIIYMAAISGIDQEQYEAARVDGAGYFQCALHVTLPAMMETFVVLFILNIGNFLNTGYEQYLLFKNSLTATNIEVLDLYTYRIGLQNMDYSYGVAISVVKSLVSITLVVVANLVAKKSEVEQLSKGEKIMGEMKIKSSPSRKAFLVFDTLLMILLALICIYPFWYVLCYSFSDTTAASVNPPVIHPAGFTLSNYKEILTLKGFFPALGMSVLRTVVGTGLSVFCCSFLAYLFTKDKMPARKILYRFVVFTMYISGGMIATYIVMKSYGLLNNFWVYILPTMISAYNMILIKTYIEQLPPALEESASLDGAGYITCFFKIILPLCKPIIATVVVFVAVGQWNSWFDNHIYTRANESLTTLQYLLYNYLNEAQRLAEQLKTASSGADMTQAMAAISPKGIRMTITVLASLPIFALYPFMQKYFSKGIMVGAVKG